MTVGNIVAIIFCVIVTIILFIYAGFWWTVGVILFSVLTTIVILDWNKKITWGKYH